MLLASVISFTKDRREFTRRESVYAPNYKAVMFSEMAQILNMSENFKAGLIAFLAFSLLSLLFGDWILVHVILLMGFCSVLLALNFKQMNKLKSMLLAIPCSLVVTIAVYFVQPELGVFKFLPRLFDQI